ncbi:hypothetical protein GmHk_18G052204 [Glycine max]|nr:hypothetical protein GmHk_18G052204 [Glycine max]
MTRPKNDEERTTNGEERLKIFAKSPTETKIGEELATQLAQASQNFTDCVTMLPFDFRHLSGLHVWCDKGCQVPQSGQKKVACHQTIVPGRN